MSGIFYEDDKGKLFNGDVKLGLRYLKDTVDMIITSPPYWALRDYHTSKWEGGNDGCDHVKDYSKTSKLHGYYYSEVCEKCGAIQIDNQLGQEATFKQYIEDLCNIFDMTWDILKETGTLWVNLGDTFYGSNKGAGGKTNKQLTNPGSYYNKNNKDSSLQNSKDFKNNELPRKSLCQIPSRFAIEMQERGWILRNDIIWHKPNKFPESCKDRFTHDYEHLFFFTKISSGYYYEQQLEPAKESSIKRMNYGWNGMLDDGVSWAGNGKYMGSEKGKQQILKGRNMRSVWSINTESKKGLNHFASYPRKLIEAPIKAGCPEGGTVMDIFMGSGTTGIVAESLNRKWIGIELNPEYCEISKERILEARNNE